MGEPVIILSSNRTDLTTEVPITTRGSSILSYDESLYLVPGDPMDDLQCDSCQ